MPAQRAFQEHRGRLGILRIGIWCPFHRVVVIHFRPVSIPRYMYWYFASAPRKIWRRPPQNIVMLTKQPIFAATPQNFPSMSHLVSYVDGNKVLIW